MKSDFVNLVSHEVRSPLSSIIMQHKVILEGLAWDLTDKQRELLMRAHDKIQGLLELINDLLDLAKIESGHRHLEEAPLALGEVLTELVELLRPRAEDQKIVLALSVAPDLPSILGDRRAMDEVFTNLITNAIKYSPDGGDRQSHHVTHPGRMVVGTADAAAAEGRGEPHRLRPAGPRRPFRRLQGHHDVHLY